MKNLLIITCILFTVNCKCQSVRLLKSNDTVWYSLDKKAAQNLIYKANKGQYFDQYVSYRDKMLDQVIQAKVKGDQIQIKLQQQLGECRSYLLKSEKDKVKIQNDQLKIENVNKKLKNQRNVMIAITALAAIVTGLSL